jgi:hypothetical protein
LAACASLPQHRQRHRGNYKCSQSPIAACAHNSSFQANNCDAHSVTPDELKNKAFC